MGILDTRSIVPVGESGAWCVEKFTTTPREVSTFNLRESIHGTNRHVEPGSYTRLVRLGGWRGRTVVMSDTRAELLDHYDFVRQATGHVLINGLGLGLCLQMVLAKDDVKRVTVVERSRDVIRLTWPTFMEEPRAGIYHASAFDWQPPRGIRYGAVWHDIWDYICADNLPEMKALHRKYGRRTDWQGSRCRAECRG